MKKLLYLVLLLTSFSSCKKYLDVNTDPNESTDAPPKVLLPTTSVGIAWVNANNLGRAASILVQHNAGVLGDPDDYDVYRLEGTFENQWNNELYPVIKNLRIIISKTGETSPAYAGIAKLQMAYAFSIATDLWGDVPYSEAGVGMTITKPRFDKQEDIYLGNSTLGIQGLFDLVREGLADLDKASATKPTTDDIIYGGDVTKWKKAGNTLLLKLAIQVSNVKPDVTKSVISSVLTSNNYITNNAEDFEVKFFAALYNQNPIYAFDYGNRTTEQMMSSRFLNFMRNLNDTVRLAKFYTKPNGIFQGYNNGDNVVAPLQADRSRYNTYVVGTSGEAPIRLLTNFQRAFILAESALLFGTAGDPNALYQEGIRASMTKTGMTTAEINTYFADNPTIVNLTGTTEDKRKQIITQKYVAWVGNGIEAYNDYRRTGYPQLVPSLNAVGDDPNVIPKRLPYSTTESQRNPNQPNPRPRTNEKVWWGL
ncbi:SusD/RagB family nutrient-binding outer membrane lipoprotein [Segetibacter sp. 3557_3]|uniref:SusD/RagB family nutrient-binding outer membrane lipoprotein n=1 Tax=Segetibacter sp. 3557_3 TaxID=2547429 RepID=UPI0010589406|nr:SusD/RagB family nutrient-binding outer membrane lipoprotein [Segetibacter sp. 3557_3]TDH24076.1 SusD/RagB family nutrient-binding outer membrane lipoprotein [Segetibacter sp. 3557_3]